MSQDPTGVLSQREMEILQLVAQGLSNKEIARELVISTNTVKVHLRNIFGKLEVNSRTEATMVAVRQGWVVVDLEIPEGEAVAGPTVEAPAPAAPIALWQRAFLVAVLVAVALALVWTWPVSAPPQKAPDNPLADGPRPATPAEPPPSRWQEEASISIARARLTAVAFNGFIYAIGGQMPGGYTGAVEAFDPVAQTWTLKATKPVPVANIVGAVLGDKVYVPGGSISSEQVTDVVEVYDPVADQWEQAAPLPSPRAAYALAVHSEKLYLFGGTDGKQDVDTVLVYDPAADSWRTGPSMFQARAFAAAATLDNEIYVVGGYAGGHELDTCQIYLPLQEKWESCTPMLESRGGLSLVAVGGRLWAIGGGWEGYLAYNQWYDPETDTWFRFETPVSGQWRSAGTAGINGKVYVVGGWGDEFLVTNLAYQAVYNYTIFIPSVSR
jgi:DNA-binding CsgD family transcriptional regulator